MRVHDFARQNDVTVQYRGDTRLGRLLERIGVLKPGVWFTYRLPFQAPTITVPQFESWLWNGDISLVGMDVLQHELVHARAIRPWYGPALFALLATVLPLPTLFSGRWFIERHAYLADIKARRCTVDEAVTVLWDNYGMAWPKPMMRRWFDKQLALAGYTRLRYSEDA